MSKLVYLILLCILLIKTANTYKRHSKEAKIKYDRRQFVKMERSRAIGSKIILDKYEQKANKIIMKLKLEELEEGFKNPLKFSPVRNFLEAAEDIKKSKIFKILKAMPKGAVLHGHDIALVSADYVLKNLTYREHVFAKVENDNDLIELRFSKEEPTISDDEKSKNIKWLNLKAQRKVENVDEWLSPQLSLNKKDAGLDVNSIWIRFMQQFGRLTPLITYEEAWKDYFYQTLLEFYEDNVSHLEFRGLLNDVYKLDGTWLKGIEVAKLYVDVLKKFKEDHPCFFDAKFVYSPLRFVNNTSFKPYSEMITQLLRHYPKFVAGFDLVGQEDIGTTLQALTKSLLKEQRRIKFYFHAGETKWSGFHSDDNLIDAVLLGTKRIGHGYAISKHPKVGLGSGNFSFIDIMP